MDAILFERLLNEAEGATLDFKRVSLFQGNGRREVRVTSRQ